MAAQQQGKPSARERLLRLWYHHPRLGLALRTAVAAGLAWLIVNQIPAAREYAYYAPLGAVVATSVSVVSSLKESLRAALAILLGALVALVIRALLDPGVLMVICVVAVGVVLAGWKYLGDMGSWVPTAALFVLIVGQKDPWHYVASYGGLVLLGGLIGTAVALIFPQLPIAPTDRALLGLRVALVEQLEELADGLDAEDAPDGQDWHGRFRPLDSVLWEVRDQVHRAEESRRWNVRVLRYREALDRIGRHAQALERVAWLVQDITQIIIEDERQENEVLGLGQQLRPPVVAELRAMAAALRSVDDEGTGEGELATARQRLDELAHEVGAIRSESEDGLHVASNLVNSARRILQALAPMSSATA